MSDTNLPDVAPDKRKLDDVMLAMDVVDTLRHREIVLAKELNAEGREEQLLKRLREIYDAQGIDVPDRVLLEGVKALEEQRFSHTPPKPSFQVKLAKIYINRQKWVTPVVAVSMAATLLLGTWQFAVVGPEKAKAAAAQVELTQTLPAQLGRLRMETQDLASERDDKRRAEAIYQNGMAGISDGNVDAAQAAVRDLQELQKDLSVIYDVRVVYGQSEPRSGVFRIPNDAPDTRNYYLIVEAVDPSGNKVTVPLVNEENQKTHRASKWGQRVSEEVFYAVANDKADDQIIQNDILGSKEKGKLSPDYRVATPGGAILEW
ncbi:MAG: DUF6384 family protein [Hyphomonas sp.]